MEYVLKQLHIRRGEHRLDGRVFPVELQFELEDTAKQMLILAVMLELGTRNEWLDALQVSRWSSLTRDGKKEATSRPFSAAWLLPSQGASKPVYFSYDGSLTYPPCHQRVTWVVLSEVGSLARALYNQDRRTATHRLQHRQMAQTGQQMARATALRHTARERVQRELLVRSHILRAERRRHLHRLLKGLLDLKDHRELASAAVWNVLSRPPEPRELQVLADYLDKRSDRPTEAVRQVVWSLLTSTEFRFNH
jgi:hypothetical protein